MNASFLVVETDFYGLYKPFVIYFSETPASESFFRLAETYFWTNPSFRYWKKIFL